MRLLLITCAVLLLSGCSGAAQQEASAAAVRFLAAEPAEACGLLAPATSDAVAKQAGGDCARGLGAIERPRVGTVLASELAGESAQVRLDTDVVFLARFPDGWRVTAAGCVRVEPDPEVPYQCEVEP